MSFIHIRQEFSNAVIGSSYSQRLSCLSSPSSRLLFSFQLFLNFTRFHPLGTFCLHTILGLLCWRVLAFPLSPCCWSVCVSCIIHSYLGSRWNKRFHAFKYMPKQTHLGLCVCEREMERNRVCRRFSLISHMRFCAEALMLAPKDKISF